eukprot:8312374-Pyramimonas_sp.AAC.1
MEVGMRARSTSSRSSRQSSSTGGARPQWNERAAAGSRQRRGEARLPRGGRGPRVVRVARGRHSRSSTSSCSKGRLPPTGSLTGGDGRHQPRREAQL